MGKKQLKLIDQTPADLSAPPPTLGEAGRTLWSSITSEYDIGDSGGLAMLEQACSTMDRIAEYSTTIDRDGATIRTKSGVREHPLLKHELAARSFVVRTLQRLGLDVEPLKAVGRPPRPTSWSP
jgi:hypothetical protein